MEKTARGSAESMLEQAASCESEQEGEARILLACSGKGSDDAQGQLGRELGLERGQREVSHQ